MPSISIIVPIYNVEKYLPMCIDSLLKQTLQDIEVILIDDGSQDRSGTLADEYAIKDHRIKVVHQKNGGLGPARNSGLALASGTYIGFVDGDDWANPEMFESLYLAARQKKADIIAGGHCEVSRGVKTCVKPHPLAGRVIEGAFIAPMRLNLYGRQLGDTNVKPFPRSVCMSIYRRDLIAENNLCFREILSEDIFFNLDAYQVAKRIVFTEGVGYRYRKDGQASITRTFSEAKLARYMAFMSALMEKAAQEPEDIRESCIMRARCTAIDYSRLYFGLIVQSGLSGTQQKLYAQQFIESGFLDYSRGFPLNTLPFKQNLFQRQLEKGNARTALLMASLRLSLKKDNR